MTAMKKDGVQAKAPIVEVKKSVPAVKEEPVKSVPALKKEPEKSVPVEAVKTAAKEEPKKAPAKKAAPTPAKKTPVKKSEPKASVVVEYDEKQIAAKDVLENAKKAFKKLHKNVDIKTIDLYIKPEEGVAYYVVNGEGSSDYKVEL